MTFVAPFRCLEMWLVPHTNGDTGLITCLFDDFVDILRGMVVGIPVDDDFYRETYPSVAKGLAAAGYTSFQEHFYKHGYFERRQPFHNGFNGLAPPIAFDELVRSATVFPSRQGRLCIEFTKAYIRAVASKVLQAVPVDERWYLATYPEAAKAVKAGEYLSAADHYAYKGYFDGYLPHNISVDAEWYVDRYEHVRRGLAQGVASSAQDHFLRIGYKEGCRPVSP